MYTINVGSFLLNGQILLFLAFGLAGWSFLRIYERKMKWGDELGSISFQAFLIWLLMWKGSLLILEPASVLQQPSSLIYFDGGVRGRWVATLSVLGYTLYQILKGRMSIRKSLEAATIFLLGGLSVYYFGLSWFEWGENPFLPALSILFFIVLLSFFFAKGQILWVGLVERGLWLSLGLVAVRFMNIERNYIILSFDFVQLVYLAIAGVLFLTATLFKKR